MIIDDTIWQGAELTHTFLEGVRGAIPLAHEQIDIMLRLIKAAQPNLGSVLDLGCGDGILGHNVLKHFPEATAVFVDFSDPMLDAAKSRIGNRTNASFLAIDYGQKDWLSHLKDHSEIPSQFSSVVSGFSIHHQPDSRKQEIYQDIYNLLVPGGIFINIEHVSSPSPWIENQFETLFIDSLFAYQRKTGSAQTRHDVATEFYNRPDKAANILAPVSQQCQWLCDIGFKEVDTYLKIFELAVFGGIKPNK